MQRPTNNFAMAFYLALSLFLFHARIEFNFLQSVLVGWLSFISYACPIKMYALKVSVKNQMVRVSNKL